MALPDKERFRPIGDERPQRRPSRRLRFESLETRRLLSLPANVILMIGDGMGFEHVEAARMFLDGQIVFDDAPFQAKMTIRSANSTITDSAASATAMATGQKVNNGVISVALPGDGTALTTSLEILQGRGKSTGLVTTTTITHATPAAFAAHTSSRDNASEIASDLLTLSSPDVLFGGGGEGMTRQAAIDAGYTVVRDTAQMSGLNGDATRSVSGQFGSGDLPYEYDGLGNLPHLSQMTDTALDILDNDPDGFFLMVEGGRIDHASHANDIERAVRETVEFANTVQVVLDWAAGRADTLIVVTADHEAGGLTVVGDKGPGNAPDVTWSTGGHTNDDVPVYAWGVGADLITGTIDNTAIFAITTAEQPDLPDDGGDDGSNDDDDDWVDDPGTVPGHDPVDPADIARRPRASLNASPITSEGNLAYDLQVTYVDDESVRVDTIDTGDIRVVGPGNIVQYPSCVSRSSSDATRVTGTYRVTPPGGSWGPEDNGVYYVYMVMREVGDTSNLYVAPAMLDTFHVQVPLPSLTIHGDAAGEGDHGSRGLPFSVSMSKSVNYPVSVHYTTSNGTAVAGEDYSTRSGTMRILPGRLSGTIVISVNGDTIAELDETFFLALSSPQGATIASSRALGTIRNDDQGLIVSSTEIAVPEGGSRQFTVRLSAKPTLPTTASISRHADADPDLSIDPTSLTFTPENWDQTQTVTVTARQDADRVNGVARFTISSAGVDASVIETTEADDDSFRIIDDSDPQCTFDGRWVLYPWAGAAGNYHYSDAGDGFDVATWSFALPPGEYRLAATWLPKENWATNAPFTVWDGSVALETVRVNQKLAPADFTDAYAAWKDLGTFTITDDRLVVRLSDDADGRVTADSVRIEPVGNSTANYPGDADLSGATDLSDFNVWNAHKFTAATDWARGDFNGDGYTDLSDFNIWNAYKFTSAPVPTPVTGNQEENATAASLLVDRLACLDEARSFFTSRRPTKREDLVLLALDRVLASYWPL